jgi:hypothetical protein
LARTPLKKPTANDEQKESIIDDGRSDYTVARAIGEPGRPHRTRTPVHLSTNSSPGLAFIEYWEEMRWTWTWMIPEGEGEGGEYSEREIMPIMSDSVEGPLADTSVHGVGQFRSG